MFGEAHRYLLVVARDKAEAKQLAKQRLQADWLKPHTDAVLDVDDCLPIDWVNGRYVHLIEGPHAGLRQYSDYILL